MRIFQKIVFISGLIVAGVYFIYTLSFSTGWARGESFGVFFIEAQVVNKLLYKLALWTLVFAALNIIFHAHTNRNYYLTNYLLILLFTASLIVSGAVTVMKVPPLKTSYLSIDKKTLEFITALNYSKVSTMIFDIGIYLSVLMFIQSLLVVLITIYKIITQIKRAKIKKMKRLEIAYEYSEH